MRLANLVRPAQHTASATGRGTFAGLVAAVCVTLLVWLLHSAFPKDGFLFLDIPLVGIVAYYFGSVPGFIAGLVAVLAAMVPHHSARVHPARVSGTRCPILVLFWAVLTATIEGAARLRVAQAASSRLAMIVQSADDAILSESLDGIILTWNAGAERLYGYSAAEAIGKPITMLAPADRLDEQRQRLALLRRGDPIQRYESVADQKGRDADRRGRDGLLAPGRVGIGGRRLGGRPRHLGSEAHRTSPAVPGRGGQRARVLARRPAHPRGARGARRAAC